MTIEKPRPAKRRLKDGRLGQQGQALVEFALLAPLLLVIVYATAQFALLLNQYAMLVNAVSVGARQFSISGIATTTPYTGTIGLMQSAASTLNSANLSIYTCVGANSCASATATGACTTDSACLSALQAAAPSGGVLTPTTVTATIPCGAQFIWSDLYKAVSGFWGSTCMLKASFTESVQ
jgi:Flp pilus assembly protein TadG